MMDEFARCFCLKTGKKFNVSKHHIWWKTTSIYFLPILTVVRMQVPCPYNEPHDASSYLNLKQGQILLCWHWICTFTWDDGYWAWWAWACSRLVQAICIKVNCLFLITCTYWAQIRHDHPCNASSCSKRYKNRRMRTHCNYSLIWKSVGAQCLPCWIEWRLNKM